jgi:hypothetical protein
MIYHPIKRMIGFASFNVLQLDNISNIISLAKVSEVYKLTALYINKLDSYA